MRASLVWAFIMLWLFLCIVYGKRAHRRKLDRGQSLLIGAYQHWLIYNTLRKLKP